MSAEMTMTSQRPFNACQICPLADSVEYEAMNLRLNSTPEVEPELRATAVSCLVRKNPRAKTIERAPQYLAYIQALALFEHDENFIPHESRAAGEPPDFCPQVTGEDIELFQS